MEGHWAFTMVPPVQGEPRRGAARRREGASLRPEGTGGSGSPAPGCVGVCRSIIRGASREQERPALAGGTKPPLTAPGSSSPPVSTRTGLEWAAGPGGLSSSPLCQGNWGAGGVATAQDTQASSATPWPPARCPRREQGGQISESGTFQGLAVVADGKLSLHSLCSWLLGGTGAGQDHDLGLCYIAAQV